LEKVKADAGDVPLACRARRFALKPSFNSLAYRVKRRNAKEEVPMRNEIDCTRSESQ